MKRLFLSFAYLLLNIGLLHSQSVGGIRNIDTKDFPSVSFVIHSDNPVIQDVSQFQVSEDGLNVSSFLTETLETSRQVGASRVLFLWDVKGQESFVSMLLSDFFLGVTTNDSLNILVNVAIFRRENNGEKVYELLMDSFTSDLGKVDEAVTDKQQLTNILSSSDIIWALNKTVDDFGRMASDGPKAIVLFTEGKNNMDSGIDISGLVSKAKRSRVFIYVVNIKGGEAGKTLSESLSMGTYGLYLDSEGTFDTRDKREKDGDKYIFKFSENETIKAWITDLPKRWEGITYKVTFQSNYERIDREARIYLTLGDETFDGSYQIPDSSFGLWIKGHLILFIALLVVSLAAISTGMFFLIRHLRDIAADKKEERDRIEAERKKMRSDQETLRRKLEIAENEQRRKQEKELAQKKQAEHNEKLASINALMMSKNIRARVLIITMSGSYEALVTVAETTIGTAEDNMIVISDPTVSRHHAVLYFDGERFGIRDLRSTNGIVMNGFKVEDLTLRNGDSVSLGNTTIKIYF